MIEMVDMFLCNEVSWVGFLSWLTWINLLSKMKLSAAEVLSFVFPWANDFKLERFASNHLQKIVKKMKNCRENSWLKCFQSHKDYIMAFNLNWNQDKNRKNALVKIKTKIEKVSKVMKLCNLLLNILKIKIYHSH